MQAARLRTLPLSVSGVIAGTALANYYGYYNVIIFILSIATTIGFQVTSNFANDYGDGVKGTDNEDRIGPKRALQSGILSRKELKRGIYIASAICLLLVLSVIYFSFGVQNIVYPLVFLLLGVASIWAAIKYTVGKSAYGYKGMGDIFVFLFFGLLSVLGTLFLYTKFITLPAILPAVAIGLLSTGVLNLNNLRDFNSDKKAKKNTLVVKMGFNNGKKYHIFLLIGAFISVFSFLLLEYSHWKNIFVFVAFIPIAIQLVKVHKTTEAVTLDPELKKLALSTFALAILFYITF